MSTIGNLRVVMGGPRPRPSLRSRRGSPRAVSRRREGLDSWRRADNCHSKIMRLGYEVKATPAALAPRLGPQTLFPLRRPPGRRGGRSGDGAPHAKARASAGRSARTPSWPRWKPRPAAPPTPLKRGPQANGGPSEAGKGVKRTVTGNLSGNLSPETAETRDIILVTSNRANFERAGINVVDPFGR